MSHRALAALLTAVALGATAAGCGSEDEGATGTAAAKPAASDAKATDAVVIKDFTFGPKAAKVKVGDSITFTNRDTAPHTATVQEGPGKFDTGTLERGQSKTIRFTKAGTFQYVCLFHLYMKGTVTVVA